MTTITKEFAQDIIKGHGYGVAPSAVEELARIALASLEAEPVAMGDHRFRELVNTLRDIAIEYHGTQQLRERIARACRAAMLQDGNHTEQHLDMVDHSGDTDEKVESVSESRNTPAPQQEAKRS
ncbi:hypothetical protein NMD75_04120 [Edwardsiella tarda]